MWHQWDPGSEMNEAAGLRMAAGSDVSVQYNVERAAVIVCSRRRFLQLRRRPSPLLAAVRRATPARRRGLPAVRGRDDAVDDGREGGSSPAAEAEPDRAAGARAGRRRSASPASIAAARFRPTRRRGSPRFATISTHIAARASSSPAKVSRPSFTRSRTR